MKVRLFGVLQSTLKADSVDVTEKVSTVADLEKALMEQYPDLVPHQKTWRVAVDQEYARGPDPVTAHSEVAIIPPVSGG